ncbi:acyltransferase family protein [Imhoffiella purpurea]|uniref:Acyltransferase 3 domain-containing protein n=1 Tax=Imhoffiella purpurea TaxID=1249627 RepID=W9VD46_9GAMM|nr:acyltransferase [Imhoffiella purpurea]EXJ14901.1 hypothetical protein D779_2107 [Imhoffiella purpurea]
MTDKDPIPDASRSLGIDLLRGACILYIVGYWHLIPYTTALPGYANWFTEGLKYVALSTFVFCSGYLLARARIQLDPSGLGSFYRRRLLRIYPLYLVALVAFGLYGIASWKQVQDGILLTSMFTPPAMPTLWFVTMIMVFYLAAPFLIRTADRALPTLLLGLLLTCALAAQHLWVRHIDMRILMYLPVFVLGILYRRQPSWRALAERHRWLLLALAALLLPTSQIGNESTLSGGLMIVPLLLTSATAAVIFADGLAARLHAGTVERLAYASFGLYLVHRLVFKASIALYFPAEGWNQVGYLLAAALPISLAIGYGMQRGYDRLASRWNPRHRGV